MIANIIKYSLPFLHDGGGLELECMLFHVESTLLNVVASNGYIIIHTELTVPPIWNEGKFLVSKPVLQKLIEFNPSGIYTRGRNICAYNDNSIITERTEYGGYPNYRNAMRVASGRVSPFDITLDVLNSSKIGPILMLEGIDKISMGASSPDNAVLFRLTLVNGNKIAVGQMTMGED